MQAWPLTLFLGLMPAFAAATPPADTPASRHEAAVRYARVSDVPKLMQDAVDALAQKMTPDRRAVFRTLMLDHVRTDVIEAAMVASMEKHFTTQELTALGDFYGSEVGRSAMAKFGVYMGDVMPLIEAELMRAFTELQKQNPVQPSGT